MRFEGEYLINGYKLEGMVRAYDETTTTDDLTPVGRCGFEISQEGVIELATTEESVLFVEESKRGNGFGKRILREALSYARRCAEQESRQLVQAEVRCMDFNTPARRVVKSLGFRLVEKDHMIG